MQGYEQTHPWLTFSINLSRAPAKLWALLGEANMLSRTISGSPLLPSARERIEHLSLARAMSSAEEIEGESLSEYEIQRLVEGELRVPPSRRYLVQAKENLLDGYQRILSDLGHGVLTTISQENIREYNRIVLDSLVLPGDMTPGAYRTIDSGRGKLFCDPTPAAESEHLLINLCDWLNSNTFLPPPDMTVIYGILKTVVAHLYLTWIQPFQAGNQATTRLLEFSILVSSGMPEVAATLLGVHYSRTRSEYAHQMDLACEPGGKVVPFIVYSIRGFRDILRELSSDIRAEQTVAIRDHHIHEMFRDKTSPADLRRRELALEISRLKHPAPLARLRELTPSIARMYASRTYKTLARDVNDLIGLGLALKTEDGIAADKSGIVSFIRRRS